MFKLSTQNLNKIKANLERGVPDFSAIEQFLYRGQQAWVIQCVEMPLTMQIGAHQLIIPFFDEVLRELLRCFSVVANQGKQVELKKTPDVF